MPGPRLSDMLGTDYASWAAAVRSAGVAQFEQQLRASVTSDPETFRDAWSEFLSYNPWVLDVAAPAELPPPPPTIPDLPPPPPAPAIPEESPLMGGASVMVHFPLGSQDTVSWSVPFSRPVPGDYSDLNLYAADLDAWYQANPADRPSAIVAADAQAALAEHKAAYVKQVGRDPSPAELATWVSYYGTPERLAQLEADLARVPDPPAPLLWSTEYQGDGGLFGEVAGAIADINAVVVAAVVTVGEGIADDPTRAIADVATFGVYEGVYAAGGAVGVDMSPAAFLTNVGETIADNPVRAVATVGTFGSYEAVRAIGDAVDVSTDRAVQEGAVGFAVGGVKGMVLGAGQSVVQDLTRRPADSPAAALVDAPADLDAPPAVAMGAGEPINPLVLLILLALAYLTLS